MPESSFEELMQSVADLSRRAMPAAWTCGITRAQDGHVITVASVDAQARQFGRAQYELDTGLCLQALRTRSGRVGPGPDRRGPLAGTATRRAAAYGVGSVPSGPLLVDGRPIGALNLYARTAGAFDEDSRAAAAQLAALAPHHRPTTAGLTARSPQTAGCPW